MDDYDWRLSVVDKCPLFIQELDREEVVEWVVEQTEADVGFLQVAYTRCDALNRPFVSASVTANIWKNDPLGDGMYLFRSEQGFCHIGLAKRWLAACHELWLINQTNRSLGGEIVQMRTPIFQDEFDDDEGDDWFGLED